MVYRKPINWQKTVVHGEGPKKGSQSTALREWGGGAPGMEILRSPWGVPKGRRKGSPRGGPSNGCRGFVFKVGLLCAQLGKKTRCPNARRGGGIDPEQPKDFKRGLPKAGVKLSANPVIRRGKNLR